jgi:cytochrome P450
MLPELARFIPGGGTDGYPEDFNELFSQTDARLLRGPLEESTFQKGGVVVFRNKDLRELAANPAVGVLSSSQEFPSFHRFVRNLVFATNPPIHGQMRHVIARPLMPRQIPRLIEVAKRIAEELIDEVAGQGAFDFCSRFSERLTARFWGALFEMTDGETERLADAARAVAPIFLLRRTAEETSAVARAMDNYIEFLADVIDRALERGGNDLLEAMAASFHAIEDERKPDRVAEMIAANVFEGVHTAAVAASNVLFQLLLCPDALAAVRADVSLAANAVTEGLRLSPPVTVLGRCALTDIEFAGTLIPQGTAIAMLWGAGNRDPETFERPNRYDLLRKNRSETTFGGGAHICPGRYVARMLAHVVLETVLAPDLRIELAGNRPAWIARSSVRQLERMQVIVARVSGPST